MGEYVKPPLGIWPFWFHNEMRLKDINDAIQRYEEVNLEIPKEWIAEKESLDAYFRDK